MAEAKPAEGPSGIDRRRLLAIAALTGVGLAGGGLIWRAAQGPSDPAARIVSPEFVARISDIVLPATGTLGAGAAGVPQFLPLALEHGLFGGDATTLGTLETVLDGIAKPGGFMQAAADRQVEMIRKLDADTFARRAPPPPRVDPAHAENREAGSAPALAEPLANRLWRIVKLGIVISYYTSEVGGSKELTYQLAAGPDYRADVALGSVPYLSNYWIENAF